MKNLRQRIRKELRSLIPPTIFFLVVLGLLALTRRLLLAQYGITPSDAAGVVIGALIAGKVVLLANAMPFIDRYPGKPLIYNIVWKSAIYIAAAQLVHVGERLIPLVIKYSSVREAVSRAAQDIDWPHFLILTIWFSVLLFVYAALAEFVMTLGRDEVLKLLFGIESREDKAGSAPTGATDPS